MYCAVIGDIVESKKINNRNQVQVKLKEILHNINLKYSNDIASGFTITLGDEFQGVLHSPNKILEIITSINDIIYPINIRYGIGFGDIKTKINTLWAIGDDGPAYYNARDAVNNLKQNERKYESAIQLKYLKTGYYDAHVNLVNSCFALCDRIESSWTEKQRITVSLMKKNNENQSDVARVLGINKSSVHNSLSASKYYYYTSAVEALQRSIVDIWERLNDK